jgi:radical SAM protein with 4Fe4S-binding SPASM domain
LNQFKLKEMKIEVTYNCPLSCIHCSSDANPKNQLSMTFEKCLEIINSALSIGVKEITLSGGEPFTWEGIIEIIAFLKSKGPTSSIYTTGNCDNLDKLMKKLKTAGVDKLIFSLYSDNENEHDRVTRKLNSYNNTLKAIKLAKSYNINTEIHFVALASNYKKLDGIVKIAKANGAKLVSILRFVPQGRGKLIANFDTLNREQNLELKEMIINLRNNGFEIRTGSPFNVLLINNDPKCMAAQDRLIVTPDLNIYPCDAFKQISCESIAPHDEYSNLSKHTVEECWNQSKYFELVRKAIFTTKSEPCQSCKKNNVCLSGCLAQKYLYYSSLYKYPDPACLKGVK